MLHTIFVPFVFEPIALPHHPGILKKISDPPLAMVVAGFFMNLPFLSGCSRLNVQKAGMACHRMHVSLLLPCRSCNLSFLGEFPDEFSHFQRDVHSTMGI